MARNDIGYDSKAALPNKLILDDGTVTDIAGTPVSESTDLYKSKPALPNKWLNPDGTYSTLTELIAGAIDTDVFVIVDELPEEGNPKKIYLVPDGEGGFIEYHYVDGNWDPIGTVEIDLSQYSTTDEMNAAILAALNQAKAYADDNFLKKNNTTAYTPTGDYNPATKKYVDDAISNNITSALGGEY